jgi:hypothetical protein
MTSKNAEIAVLQTQMENQQLAMDDMKRETAENFRAVNEKMDRNQIHTQAELQSIKDILTEAKGGWKMFVMIGGLAATIGAIAGKALSMLVSFSKP